jgi:hypothetical protein
MAKAETLKSLLKKHKKLKHEVAKIEVKIRAKDPRALKVRKTRVRINGLTRMVPRGADW